MNQITDVSAQPALETIAQPLDMLIVGAGISGVAAARYMRKERPQDSFLVIEEMDSYGGTWLTHKYPGARSDSDLYTFGYSFKPWIGPPLATADEIRAYMAEAIAENGLGDAIHYGWRVSAANWDSGEKLWRLTLENKHGGETLALSTRFLWMCQGYYRHAKGYTPDWEGFEDFAGEVIHPQHWPEDFDGAGKHMTVIGSGATAATLVPNVVDAVDRVTMLQRSPTYFVSMPNVDETADWLRRLNLPEEWVHEIVRRNTLLNNREFQRRCFEEPEAVKKELQDQARAYLGDDFDIDTHFTPPYMPWRQRLARIPDGDLFKAVARGKADIVTDEIERFVPEGIRLKSGETLKTDIVVTATGFELSAFGDIAFSIDGKPLNFHDTVGYRSMMFTGVPNLIWVMGYFRASWTLRAEMIAEFAMKLLDHMQKTQKGTVTPQLRASEKDMPLYDWPDEEDFNPGYLLRGRKILPKRGAGNDWRLEQDFWAEREQFAAIDLEDEAFRYG